MMNWNLFEVGDELLARGIERLLSWVWGLFRGEPMTVPGQPATGASAPAPSAPPPDKGKEVSEGIAVFWAKVGKDERNNFKKALKKFTKRNRDRFEEKIGEMLGQLKNGIFPKEMEKITEEFPAPTKAGTTPPSTKAPTSSKRSTEKGKEKTGWDPGKIFVDAFKAAGETPKTAEWFIEMLLRPTKADKAAAFFKRLSRRFRQKISIRTTLIVYGVLVVAALVAVVYSLFVLTHTPSGALTLLWTLLSILILWILLAPILLTAFAVGGRSTAGIRYRKFLWWGLASATIFGLWTLLPFEVSASNQTAVSFCLLAVVSVLFLVGKEQRVINTLILIMTVFLFWAFISETALGKTVRWGKHQAEIKLPSDYFEPETGRPIVKVLVVPDGSGRVFPLGMISDPKTGVNLRLIEPRDIKWLEEERRVLKAQRVPITTATAVPRREPSYPCTVCVGRMKRVCNPARFTGLREMEVRSEKHNTTAEMRWSDDGQGEWSQEHPPDEGRFTLHKEGEGVWQGDTVSWRRPEDPPEPLQITCNT